MKKQNLNQNELGKSYNRIEKTIRKAKTEGNSSGFVLNLGKNSFILQFGLQHTAQQVCLCFKSGEELFFLNSHTQNDTIKSSEFDDLWVFIDLKLQRFFVVFNQELLEVSFLSVLYNSDIDEEKPNHFSRGFYCCETSCTFLYDRDFCQATFDMISNHFADYTTAQNLDKAVDKDYE